MELEVEMVGQGEIHLQDKESTDQNQQNFIIPTNHKNQLGYFCGEFSKLGQNQQN